jgi:hypothetical protein
MLKTNTLRPLEERLALLREKVCAEFGFSANAVTTVFDPKASTNLGPTDFIRLSVSEVPEGFTDSQYARVQPFAAGQLHGLFVGERPLVCLRMNMPLIKREDAPDGAPVVTQ